VDEEEDGEGDGGEVGVWITAGYLSLRTGSYS
jgi:hypothetical protein